MKAFVLASSVAVAAGWSFIRNTQLPQGPNRLHWAGIVFGHRGCRMVPSIPENTLDAFRYAASRGCGGIECDVRLTKDNEVVVFHDAYINSQLREFPLAAPPAAGGDGQEAGRASDAARRVNDLTLFELKECTFLADPTGQVRVPTLEESVVFCRENNLKMLIEIKEMGKPQLCADKVLDLYRRYPDYMYEQTTIISFFPQILYYARSKDRGVAVGQIYSGTTVRSALLNPAQHEKTVPLWMQMMPRLADSLVLFVQQRVVPWVAGCSLVCPRYTLFTPAEKKKWTSRRICMYLWGFESPEQCTLPMRSDGCFVAADDCHEEYSAPQAAPNFDVFGDEQRAREREEEQRRQQLKLKK